MGKTSIVGACRDALHLIMLLRLLTWKVAFVKLTKCDRKGQPRVGLGIERMLLQNKKVSQRRRVYCSTVVLQLSIPVSVRKSLAKRSASAVYPYIESYFFCCCCFSPPEVFGQPKTRHHYILDGVYINNSYSGPRPKASGSSGPLHLS